MKHKLLIVDDDPVIRETLNSFFSGQDYEVMEAESGSQVIAMLKAGKKESFAPDAVLLDVMLPDLTGMEVLEAIKTLQPDACVLLITGHGSVPQSVEAMKKGAADYVLKPFNLDDILLRLQKALSNRKLMEQVEFLNSQRNDQWTSQYAVGHNARMAKIYETIERIAKSGSSTVLIHGETGTGKEMIAHRIHTLSDRANKPFVAVNATALSPELLESELFGHEAGSFTGASKAKKGLFEVADGGTLFLDEIGDMDLSMQAKVLRAIQEKKIRRVGGTENIDVDIRLVTATNRNLQEAVRLGEFREDLYYRLNVVPVDLPPLRERREDIEALVRHFIKAFNTEFRRQIREVDPEAIEALQQYAWPGNIRELRNLIERTILLECDGDTLKLEHLIRANRQLANREGGGAENASSQGTLGLIGQTVSLEEVEREHIEAVLSSTNGNKNQAAQILGIDRTTLYNKLKKYQKQ